MAISDPSDYNLTSTCLKAYSLLVHLCRDSEVSLELVNSYEAQLLPGGLLELYYECSIIIRPEAIIVTSMTNLLFATHVLNKCENIGTLKEVLLYYDCKGEITNLIRKYLLLEDRFDCSSLVLAILELLRQPRLELSLFQWISATKNILNCTDCKNYEEIHGEIRSLTCLFQSYPSQMLSDLMALKRDIELISEETSNRSMQRREILNIFEHTIVGSSLMNPTN